MCFIIIVITAFSLSYVLNLYRRLALFLRPGPGSYSSRAHPHRCVLHASSERTPAPSAMSEVWMLQTVMHPAMRCHAKALADRSPVFRSLFQRLLMYFQASFDCRPGVVGTASGLSALTRKSAVRDQATSYPLAIAYLLSRYALIASDRRHLARSYITTRRCLLRRLMRSRCCF